MKDKLDIKHPEWLQNQDVWQDVFYYENPHLAASVADRWLSQRLGESAEVYRDRLLKFTFTPIVHDAILDFLKKLSTGTLSVKPEFPDIKNLVLSVARHCMLYGKIWFILSGDNLQLVNPQSVINWGYGDDGLLDFAVIKSEFTKTTPEKEPVSMTQWQVLTRSDSVLWVDDGFSVREVDRQSISGVPLMEINPPKHLWIAALCYLKQRQYLAVENAMLDTISSTYIQRTFEPFLRPDDDLTESYLNAVPDHVVSSNKHIIEGKFAFNEPTGQSVSSALEVLNKIEYQIRELVSRGNIPHITNQSGLSKMYDYSDYDNHVRYFATFLLDWMRRVFTWLSDNGGTRYQIDGLDSFSLNRTAELVGLARDILPVVDRIPDNYLTVFFDRLGAAIADS